jgi:hypothetical protein
MKALGYQQVMYTTFYLGKHGVEEVSLKSFAKEPNIEHDLLQ